MKFEYVFFLAAGVIASGMLNAEDRPVGEACRLSPLSSTRRRWGERLTRPVISAARKSIRYWSAQVKHDAALDAARLHPIEDRVDIVQPVPSEMTFHLALASELQRLGQILSGADDRAADRDAL
jgi:hypothetical protein